MTKDTTSGLRYVACTRVVCLAADGSVSYAHEPNPIDAKRTYGTEARATHEASRWIAGSTTGGNSSEVRLEACAMDARDLADRDAIRRLVSRGWAVTRAEASR